MCEPSFFMRSVPAVSRLATALKIAEKIIASTEQRHILWRMKALILLVGLLTASVLSARTLTSSDGAKTIVAEIKDYNPATDRVLIRQEGSDRDMDLEASSFSVGDRVHFHDFLKDATKRRMLDISVRNKTDRLRLPAGIYTYIKNDEVYTISVTNKGVVDLAELTVKYDIYASVFDDKGSKKLEVTSGESSIYRLPAKQTENFDSKAVRITRSCATSSSCPKCVRFAASVQRERIVGIHVRMYDEKGQMITEYHSSNGIKNLASKQGSSES